MCRNVPDSSKERFDFVFFLGRNCTCQFSKKLIMNLHIVFYLGCGLMAEET